MSKEQARGGERETRPKREKKGRGRKTKKKNQLSLLIRHQTRSPVAKDPAPIRLMIFRELAGMKASSPTSFWKAWSFSGGAVGAGDRAALTPVASVGDGALAAEAAAPLAGAWVASGLVSDCCFQSAS